jgi:PAS domain S-box-containing protein
MATRIIPPAGAAPRSGPPADGSGRWRICGLAALAGLGAGGVALAVVSVVGPGAVTRAHLVLPALLVVAIGVLTAVVLAMQQRLRRERDLYHALADLSLEFATFRRTDGRFEYISPAVHSLTGYTQEDFYLRPELFERIIHPDDLTRWQQHVQHLLSTGRTEALELRIVTRDGQVRWIEHTAEVVRGADGFVAGLRSVNVDVTKRKRSELHVHHLAN